MSMAQRTARAFPRAAPDGLIAAVLLSFLATAGLFYVNIMAALVDGLVQGLHFTERQAGFVASANVYGAAFGALMAVFFVRRVSWRKLSVLLLCGLIAADLLSILIKNPSAMIAMRLLHGTIGGMLVGTGFSVIARTRVPDRTFGMLLVVQFGLGGLGLMFLPRLVPIFGPAVLFIALALFSVVTLAMVPFLSEYPMRAPAARDASAARTRWIPLLLAFASVILFQAGNMALAAFMIELGHGYGLKTDFMSTILGVAGWIGAFGSLMVVFFGTRFGRFRPLLIALVLTVIGNALFLFSRSPFIYAAANIGTSVTWAFVISYLLGMCAAFDRTGQTAAMGGFASKLGLATGPLVGGFLIVNNSYTLLIDVSVAILALSAVAALVPAALLDRVSPRAAI
jgi:predicted MFS family arabinose efflux permease